MGGRRAQPYRTNRMFAGAEDRTTRHRSADAAYRLALGLTDGEMLPRALGQVAHNRPLPTGPA